MISRSRLAQPLHMLDAAVEVGARVAVDGMRRGYRMMSNLPVIGEALQHGLDSVSELALAERIGPVRHDVRISVMSVVSSVLDEIDLTSLIRDRIDVNQVLEMIDLDAALARMDVVPVLQRVDIDDVVARLDVDHVVAGLDINSVVSRLDLDAVVSQLDVDALVGRLDVDSILRRIDLVGLVAGLRDRLSWSALIRSSSRRGAPDVDTDSRSVQGVAAGAPAAERSPGESSRPPV